MGGYVKNIAVIKTLKNGFSSDGGPLSGLVKCEKYGAFFHAEVSFINFAPLSEGRYVCGISDGLHKLIVEDGYFEGDSELNNAAGFAALICYVNKTVEPVAVAVCGNFLSEIPALRDYIVRGENVKQQSEGGVKYDDEVIAEENYYEYGKADEERNALCQDQEEKASGICGGEDEEAPRAVEEEQGVDRPGEGRLTECAPAAEEEPPCGQSEQRQEKEKNKRGGGAGGKLAEDLNGVIKDPLSHNASFYAELKGEIDRVLSSFPPEERLCGVVQNSRWVKIAYGDGKFYVFGVIYAEQKPAYICYGVPSKSKTPPKSLKGLATFIPADRAAKSGEGFWVMYQDAATGASVEVEST